MRRSGALITIFSLGILSLGVLMAQEYDKRPKVESAIIVEATPTMGKEEEDGLSPPPTARPTLDYNRLSWKSVTNKEAGYIIDYPANMEVDSQANGTQVFQFLGPTQQAGYEFADGIRLVLRPGIYNQENIGKFVEAQKEIYEAQAETKTKSMIHQRNIAGRGGYSFEVNGSFRRNYIYIPLEGKNYLEIEDSTIDPTGQGFEGVVDEMLLSLKVSAPT